MWNENLKRQNLVSFCQKISKYYKESKQQVSESCSDNWMTYLIIVTDS